VEPQKTACHLSISWVISIQPTLVQPTYLTSSLISSSHLGTTVAKEKYLSPHGFEPWFPDYGHMADTLTTKLILTTLSSENEEEVRLWHHALCVLACVRACTDRSHHKFWTSYNFFYITWYTIRHWRTCRSRILLFPTLRHGNMVDARILCVPVHVTYLLPWISCLLYLRHQNPESHTQKEFIR